MQVETFIYTNNLSITIYHILISSFATMAPKGPTTPLEIDGKEYNVPTSYICPISLDIMTHPLVARSGHHFERAAIQAWLTNDDSNPLTREVMGPRDLIPDYRLEDEIRFWKENQGIIENSYPLCSDDRRNNYEDVLFTAAIDPRSIAKCHSETSASRSTPRNSNRRGPRRFKLPRLGR